MATQNPQGGGGSQTPPRPSKDPAKKWKDLFTRGAVQGFNKYKRPLARLVVENYLKPDQIAWIAAHEDELDTISTIIAAATPSQGLWELTDDFQQDFVHEVIVACQDQVGGMGGKTPAEGNKSGGKPVAPVFDETKQRNRLLLAVMKFPDQRKRDSFNLWFKGLHSAEQTKFLQFVAQTSEDELKDLVGHPTGELTILLSQILDPVAVPKQPKLGGKSITSIVIGDLSKPKAELDALFAEIEADVNEPEGGAA